MNIFVTGVSHKNTPLEIREKLSVGRESQKIFLSRILSLPVVAECIILSTCNRTEVYIYAEERKFDSDIIEKLLCEVNGLKLYDFKKYFYFYEGENAVRHLFKVASGLDSMVFGEDQILGQVKEAYETSLTEGTGSSVLNTLFRDGITAAKKVKTRTGLSRNSVSISSLAVKLLTDIFGDGIKGKRAIIIGAGKIGSIVLKNLCHKGLEKIYTTTRSHGKPEDIYKGFHSVALVDYNDRYLFMDECDIVISSTTSPHYTITRDMLEKSLLHGKERIFIDLAVPRDIDNTISEMEDIRYYNIDHFKSVSDENFDKRISEVHRAEQIVEEHVSQFEKWYKFRNILPLVKEIRDFTGQLAENKINETLTKLKIADDQDKELVRNSITNLVDEIVDKFIYRIRDSANIDDMQTYFKCLKDAINDNR